MIRFHKVTKLVLYHDYRMPATARNVRRAMNKIGKELFPLYLEVRRADMLAQSDYLREEKLRNIDETAELYREILQKGQCVTLKELAVTGSDLIAAGMKPGKELWQDTGVFSGSGYGRAGQKYEGGTS